MACRNVLIFFILSGSVALSMTANCASDTLRKCADIIEFLADKSNIIGGSETLQDFCRFNENVTRCADDAVLRCPNLKDEEYKTLISVTKKIDTEACMNGSRIQKVYKKHESCLATVDESVVLKCVQDFIVVLQVLKDSKEKDICCTFSQSRTCIRQLVLSKCGSDAANATVEVADLLSAPLIESKCGSFNFTICNMPQSSSSLTPAFCLVFLVSFFLLFSQS